MIRMHADQRIPGMEHYEDTPNVHRHFLPAPPRRFLYPAVLLLLSEAPSYGYHLVGELNRLGLTRVDRPSVYRALGEMERDGLVSHIDEAPIAGSTRHVYGLTTEGHEALEAWMAVVVKERADLDMVLKRHWVSNAITVTTSLPEDMFLGETRNSEEAQPAISTQRFLVARDRSRLVVGARTNIGPIAFSTSRLSGSITIDVCGDDLHIRRTSEAEVVVQIEDLSSGNRLYDRELYRRIDSLRFPSALLRLRESLRIGSGNCFEVVGDLTLHGVTVELKGHVAASLLSPPSPRLLSGTKSKGAKWLYVIGEQALDVRVFNLEPPNMPIFKFYTDVKLSLHLEADEEVSA